ncbi:MAG: glutathione S-transferase family protein [Gammaproteobacteria bacterium]
MAEPILHHYPLSPFAEKVRRVLAYKRLPWRAVEQPIMAPKPHLTPLTGGYRRIPVLQLGADVYCDTALILRVLERLQPAPAIFPPALAGLARVVEDWADHRFFFQAVPAVVVALIDQLPPGFLADRADMTPAFTREALIAGAPHAHAQFLQSLDRLEGQLDHGDYLLGDRFTAADAACFHPIWFQQHGGQLFDAVRARPALWRWYERIAGFGPGEPSPLDADEALAVARAATPIDVDTGDHADGEHAVGERIAVVADDYGRERTTGALVRITAEEIVLRRDDERIGEIAVHFPRAGYRLERE